MSRDYYLHCVTCHGRSRTGCGPGEINHGGLYLKALVPALPLIAQLASFELEIRLSRGLNTDIIDFAVEHHAHDVQVIDEYGGFFDECSKSLQCVCGHYENCALLDKHEGECKPHRLMPKEI